jgi:acetyltransferase-like isoleucine patch superfamily enzyme
MTGDIMNLAEFKAKIRRHETPFYRLLYSAAKNIRMAEAPYIKGWHDLLYHEKSFRVNAWRSFWRVMYHQPLFRSRCRECGPGLHIYHSGQGLPCIEGSVEITIGRDVKLYDRITIAGLTVGEHPKLAIGDNTDISQPISILVGKEVIIGSNCLIGCTMISDNPGHRIDYRERFEKLDPGQIGRIEIGDYVWAALQSIIVGNVTVGFGAVIGARAVVTRDVPPFCIVAGNPARIVKKLPFPDDMIEQLGEASHNQYMNAVVEK